MRYSLLVVINVLALELSTAMVPRVIFVLFLSDSLLRFIKHITHFVYNLVTTVEVLYFKHTCAIICAVNTAPRPLSFC